MVVSVVRIIFASLVILSVLLSTNTQAAVNAILDRNEIYTGDTFILTIQASGQKNTGPDLSPLKKDFSVLSTGKSTQVSINNGKRSDSSSWTIRLQPKRNGTITIPAIKVGAEQTRPMSITIAEIPKDIADKMAQHFFIEAEADTGTDPIYVQQQIPFTVRFFYDGSIFDGELSAPTANNAVIETLGREKNYSTNKNGKQFKVLERNYAISPEKSGELSIEPIQFRGRMRVNRSQNNRAQQQAHEQAREQGRDMINRMFNDNPFTHDPFSNRQATQPVSTRSKPIVIKVLPRATSNSGNNWIPAEELTLEDSWNSSSSTSSQLPNFKSGEPVTRTITITTRGLSASQLPELKIKAPDNTRMYTDKPQTQTQTDGKTLYGINQLNITYIPEVSGKLTFPEIKIDWWNTKTNQQDSTILPALEVNIAKGTIGEPNRIITKTDQPGIGVEMEVDGNNSDSSTKQLNSAWIIWSLAIFGTAILLLLTFKNFIIPALQKRHGKTPAINPNISFQQFRQSCENNLAREAANTLLEHTQALWPDQSPRSLRELANILATGKEQVLQLDRHLYGITKTEWNGQQLWESLKNGLQRKQTTKRTTQKNTILKPLYPD